MEATRSIRLTVNGIVYERTVAVRMTLADHERTIKTLRTTSTSSLRRSARADDGTTMTAEEVARLPLVTHLEMHLEQLEQVLGPSGAASPSGTPTPPHEGGGHIA